MSLLRHQSFRDRDGNVLSAHLANGINVERTPAAREQVLARTLHTVSRAGAACTVEKTFVYIDRRRHQLFMVHPPRDRYRWRELTQEFSQLTAMLPADLRTELSYTRLVFGLEELREKLVAHDHKFDDRAVELMKVALIHEHPVLLSKPRLRLSLDRVVSAGACFRAGYDHHPKSFELTLAAPELFCADESGLRRWSGRAGRNDLYQGEAHDWVSFRRMLPNQAALADLRAFVRRLDAKPPPTVEEVRSPAFVAMLARLPRGSTLSTQGKNDLTRLSAWASRNNLDKLQDQLFEIRFGKELEDDWYRNRDGDDIDTLWQVLRALPPDHVEGNVKLREITMATGGGGAYDPTTNEIEIGRAELDESEETLQDTIRHEIGHAVHASRKDEIDGWLWERWGWREFKAGDDKTLDQWIDVMGGWTTLGISTETDRIAVRAAIREALAPGEKWGPTRRPTVPSSHPWSRKAFPPRLAYEQTGKEWYTRHAKWYRANGYAFFFNFWYGTLMVVKTDTLKFIRESRLDEYSAQSPAEFFAELYALYYDTDDRRRQKIPRDVTAWMEKNLGRANPLTPRKKPRR